MRHEYQPYGSARELFLCKDPEVLLSGAAGTGKSRACLEKLHFAALTYPKFRGLIVRKTQKSLTESAMVTFQEQVAAQALESGEVKWYGGSGSKAACFQYFGTNATINVGGLEQNTRVLSTEYDMIYVQEATELSEDDWELLTSRLRNNRMPYQQMIADCNPGPPHHWLKHREDTGKTHFIYCSHKDNPIFWDQDAQDWTDLGRQYVQGTLAGMTGVRRQRFYEGKWAAADGLVYDEFDPNVHLFDRVTPFGSDQNPHAVNQLGKYTWYFSVDFGYNHPFICQMWAEDSDGRLYLFREIYMSGKTVEDHAKDIRSAMHVKSHRIPAPKAVICDSAQPEMMEILRKELGFPVVKAKKSVSEGIDLVKTRMAIQGDGKPRIFFNRSALYQKDKKRESQKRPVCTTDEFLSYVWDTKKEAPVKIDDDGMDAMRYMVSYLDMDQRPNMRVFYW